MNSAAFLIGIPSLFLGSWIAYGFYCRASGRLPETPPRERWLLGVCEDFSRTVAIPLWVMRFFFVIYSILGIGLLLYLLYFLMMRVRRPIISEKEFMPAPQVTKIESRYYRN